MLSCLRDSAAEIGASHKPASPNSHLVEVQQTLSLTADRGPGGTGRAGACSDEHIGFGRDRGRTHRIKLFAERFPLAISFGCPADSAGSSEQPNAAQDQKSPV